MWRVLPDCTRGVATIFAFHRIKQPGQPFVDNGFYLDTTCFDRLLDRLTHRGCEIVSLDTLVERVREPKRERPMTVLTFDHGYLDNTTIAAPLLAKRR